MRTGTPHIFLSGCLLLILGLAPWAQAQNSAPCEAPPEVKAALQNLPDNRTALIESLRGLLNRFPDDLFVHQRYQDAAGWPTMKEREAVIAEYKALAEKHPGSTVYAYLALRPQVGFGTKQVLPELERLSPSVPPGYLQLVTIYQSPKFKDAQKARERLEAFLNACPSSVRGFPLLRSIDAPDFVRKNAERMRALLSETNDSETLTNFSTLWALEFRAKPIAEHEALRKQVAKDLERLRGIDPGKNRSYYSMMQEGYKLTGDAEGGKWAVAQVQRVAPQSAFTSVMTLWNEANPYPKENEPPEKRKAYNEARAKATAEWVRQWPEAPFAWYMRVNALRNVEQAEAADVEAAGENLLTTHAKSPNEFSFMGMVGGNSPALLVADLYANKGVRLDRLPDIVKQGIPQLEKSTSMGLPSDLYDRPVADTSGQPDNVHWYGWRTVADVWLKVKDKQRAHEALGEMAAMAEKSKPKADSKDPDQAGKQRTYLSREIDYWSRMAELAKLEDRRIDAIAFYQNALLARVSPPSGTQKDELAEKARALWQDMGGTNEGWQAWSSRKDLNAQLPAAERASTWTRIEKALPEFELADASGTTWKLANLKGKTALIGIWATW